MTDAVLCELHAIRDHLDRTCRVVQALSVKDHSSEDRSRVYDEHARATDELLKLRARERELMAKPEEANTIARIRDLAELWQNRRCVTPYFCQQVLVALGLDPNKVTRAVDDCELARAEGIAQGRRELAQEALALVRVNAVLGFSPEIKAVVGLLLEEVDK